VQFTISKKYSINSVSLYLLAAFFTSQKLEYAPMPVKMDPPIPCLNLPLLVSADGGSKFVGQNPNFLFVFQLNDFGLSSEESEC